MNKQHMIYLDYNATAPLRPEAWEVMKPFLTPDTPIAYNASAIHSLGQAGRKAVEQARKNVAKLINADPAQLIFNSGATEGNNTVLQSFLKHYPEDNILIEATAHPSLLQVIPDAKIIPVDENGMIRLQALKTLLSTPKKTSLVSIMLANNETGVIQNVKAISEITHQYGALLHCDATQATGRIPVDMKSHGIDFLTLSSHKIGGPQGVGALALGLCGMTPQLLHGGGQEKGARGGTENVAGIAGFGGAAKAAMTDIEKYDDLEPLRNQLELRLKAISPDIIIHGEGVKRLPNTSFFSLPKANGQNLLIALDLEGIALSNGSACSSGTVKASHVLNAMGKDEKIAANALRISLGWATKDSDIKTFLEAWEKVISRMTEKD